jgi:tetratricopeptide (TPR) repeat protein
MNQKAFARGNAGARVRGGLGSALILWAGLAAGGVPAVAAPAPEPSARGYLHVGSTLLNDGKVGQALPLLALATIAGPDVQTARPLFLVLVNQRCFDWGIEGFEVALRVLPRYPPLLECLGRRYEGMGHYGKAEALYRRWAAIDDALIEPYARLGELYDQTGHRVRALKAFDRYRRKRGDGYALRRMAAVAAAQVEALRPRRSLAAEVVPVPATSRLQAGPEPEAQFGLAVRFEHGLGVPTDPTRAAEAYGRAAQSGHAIAQLRLAQMLREGVGVARNPTQAAYWLSQAAEGDLPEAQLAIGLACLTGDGLPRDLRGAFTWIQRASDHGLPEAQFLRATMYRYGMGTPRDPDAANAWFMKAGATFLEAGRWRPARQALAASFEAEEAREADRTPAGTRRTASGNGLPEGEGMLP